MKKVLILGASGGIGYDIAAEMKQSGYDVFVSSRSLINLSPILKALALSEGSSFIADITNKQEQAKIATFVADNDIDIVINASGSNCFSAIEKQSKADIEELTQLNLIAPMELTRDLVEVFKGRGHGTLIHIGSALGAIGLPGYSTYSATKFGLRGFCQSLERELADTAIDICYFSPRATDTKLNSYKIIAMNNELGVNSDSSKLVAHELVKFITTKSSTYQVGWPEKLFVRLNGLMPELVSKSIVKQLPVYNKYLEKNDG